MIYYFHALLKLKVSVLLRVVTVLSLNALCTWKNFTEKNLITIP